MEECGLMTRKKKMTKCIKSVTTYTIRSGGFLWLNLCETMKNNKSFIKQLQCLVLTVVELRWLGILVCNCVGLEQEGDIS